MDLPYDPNDKKSIIDYAKHLEKKTLREKLSNINEIRNNRKGKGHFGQLLEEFYFFYKPNSDSEPDFPNAKLELKSTPLKQLKKKKEEYRSKERLVLNIINYEEIVKQKFETSSFWNKNASTLLIFYLHKPDADILDYEIRLVGEWNFPDTDLEIIKKDWEFIKEKVEAGNAHELSEGDTFYLGACTKGANAKKTRKQPFNDILAKQRAYSLKQGYVNHIIASLAPKASSEVYGKLITSASVAKKQTIKKIVIAKFKSLIGKTEIELIEQFNLNSINPRIKNYHATISNAIIKSILSVPLNLEIENYIEEFAKAEIQLKTVRLNKDNLPEENMSFRAFKYIEIYNEDWIKSEMKEITEKKFLFIFFKQIDTNYVLDKVKFWNMPYIDRQEVRKVWLKTKYIIQNGNIFKEYKRNSSGEIICSQNQIPIKLNNLPKKSENRVCHVRPHGRNSADTNPLPIEDKKLGVKKYTKQGFWFNDTYIRDEIYLK